MRRAFGIGLVFVGIGILLSCLTAIAFGAEITSNRAIRIGEHIGYLDASVFLMALVKRRKPKTPACLRF